MGKYVGSWALENVLHHKIQTSSVTTGAATDADTAPTWAVYEDSTATPVTTGSYSTLNAQTGFYTAALTLAALIGYEKGKTYSIRYQATVAAIIGADVDIFQIEAEVDSNSVSVTVNSNPVALAAGAITAGTITTGALEGFTVGAVLGAVTVGATAAAAISAAVTAGSIGAVTLGATAAAALVDLIWDEPKAGHVTADTYGEYLDSTTSAIKADTAAIKLQTDTLTFTTSNSIKADIKFVNGQSVTGNGQSGTEWGPGA
jgi:hypothetical protein